MSELACVNELVISALVTENKENIASRRTIVYQTLIDPTVARIAGEKNKHKLFSKFLFQLNNPAEIEFVSIEKYYEPYMTVNGRYLIDYYRKCAYTVRIDKAVTEVILLNQTFLPEQASNSTVSGQIIKLEGEERLIKETKAFLLLNRNGQESKLSSFPSAPSEKSPQELIESYRMPEISPNMDLVVIRKKILQRPNDINRVINEVFEINERSVIYTPRFRLTYKCPRIGKEAYLEFDGITSKLIKQKENIFVAAIGTTLTKLKSFFAPQ